MNVNMVEQTRTRRTSKHFATGMVQFAVIQICLRTKKNGEHSFGAEVHFQRT
jgi:hypothetical protein